MFGLVVGLLSLLRFGLIEFGFVGREPNNAKLQKWEILVLIQFSFNTYCVSGRFCRSSFLGKQKRKQLNINVPVVQHHTCLWLQGCELLSFSSLLTVEPVACHRYSVLGL